MKLDVQISKTRVVLNGEEFKYRTTGGSRKIFFGKHFVVKIDFEDSVWNMNQCANEFRLWKEIDFDDKKYFVPTVQYGKTKEYEYVVQPRCVLKMYNHLPKKYLWTEDFIYNLAKKYNLDDLFLIGCNWGISNGQPVIFDYGV